MSVQYIQTLEFREFANATPKTINKIAIVFILIAKIQIMTVHLYLIDNYQVCAHSLANKQSFALM